MNKLTRLIRSVPIQPLADRLGVSRDTVASWRIERRNVGCCEYMRAEIEVAVSELLEDMDDE